MSFDSKLDTDLYALAKAKTMAASLDVSRDGSQFAMFCADRCTIWPCHHGAALPQGRLNVPTQPAAADFCRLPWHTTQAAAGTMLGHVSGISGL